MFVFSPPENWHGNGKSHSSNGWGFPVVILVFGICSIWFVEIVLLEVVWLQTILSWKKANQLIKLPWRKPGWYHMSRRMQEPFEWILNILTLILQDTPGGNTVICTSVIETLKTHIFTTETLMMSLNLNSKTQALTVKQVIRQLLDDLIVIVRQNLRGSFSDPILSSGCSCVKAMLAIPCGTVQCGIRCRFHQQKGVWLFLLLDDSAARVGCMFPLFPCFACFCMFSHFSHRSKSRSSPCYDVFSERSPVAAEWMALEWWRCIGSPAMHGNTVLGWMLT